MDPAGTTSVFATALAKRLKRALVSSDPEFKAVDKEVRINWLTRATRG